MQFFIFFWCFGCRRFISLINHRCTTIMLRCNLSKPKENRNSQQGAKSASHCWGVSTAGVNITHWNHFSCFPFSSLHISLPFWSFSIFSALPLIIQLLPLCSYVHCHFAWCYRATALCSLTALNLHLIQVLAGLCGNCRWQTTVCIFDPFKKPVIIYLFIFFANLHQFKNIFF